MVQTAYIEEERCDEYAAQIIPQIFALVFQSELCLNLSL